jgi:hypothetical protein
VFERTLIEIERKTEKKYIYEKQFIRSVERKATQNDLLKEINKV